MNKAHHLVYVPGLRDAAIFNKPFRSLAKIAWEKQGCYPHIYLPCWEEGLSFTPKLRGIIDLIDELTEKGYKVSLIGQSAGGSAVLNAFCERRDRVNGVINITGRLKSGENVRPTLGQAARFSPAFKESVLLFETKNEPTLTDQDRARIMTIRPWLDETVPASTVAVRGSTNLIAPIVEHSIGGGLISIFYAHKFLSFLEELS